MAISKVLRLNCRGNLIRFNLCTIAIAAVVAHIAIHDRTSTAARGRCNVKCNSPHSMGLQDAHHPCIFFVAVVCY